MQILKVLILTTLIYGCSSPSKYAYIGSEKEKKKHALIIFKTLNHNPTSLSNKITGFDIGLTNIKTKQVIYSSEGLSGYPDSTHYVLLIPPGEYELTSVFFYNGSMRPSKKGFVVTVNEAEITYIGTIAKSWNFPKKILSDSLLSGSKEYFRGNCSPNEDCYDNATVFIFDEYIKLDDYFKKGNIPLGMELTKKLLH